MKTKNKTQFSKNIKKLRLSAGLTLELTAAICELGDKTSYYAYESGKSEPSISGLIRLSEFFGVSIDNLLKSEM